MKTLLEFYSRKIKDQLRTGIDFPYRSTSPAPKSAKPTKPEEPTKMFTLILNDGTRHQIDADDHSIEPAVTSAQYAGWWGTNPSDPILVIRFWNNGTEGHKRTLVATYPLHGVTGFGTAIPEPQPSSWSPPSPPPKRPF